MPILNRLRIFATVQVSSGRVDFSQGLCHLLGRQWVVVRQLCGRAIQIDGYGTIVTFNVAEH